MATKKSTTKAKTKKPAKKSASVKSSTKTASKKVAKKPAPAKSAAKTPVAVLKNLNYLSVLVSLAGAVLAYLYMSSAYTEITVSYLTQNVLENNILQSAYRLFNEISLQAALIVTLLAASVKPLLDLSKNKDSYAAQLKAKYMPKRFLDHAVQYALFAFITATVLGYTNFVTVKLVVVLAVLIALFSWLSEKYGSNKEKALQEHALDYNNLTLLTIAVLGALLSFSFVFSYAFGQVVASWYIILSWVLLVTYMLLNTLNQRMHIKGKKSFKNYEVVERNYLIVGAAARLDLAIILILGFLK